jgi:hypothetical protein
MMPIGIPGLSFRNADPKALSLLDRDSGMITQEQIRALAPAVAAAVRSADPRDREAALAALKQHGWLLFPGLLEGLRQPDPDVRVGAALALGGAGVSSRPEAMTALAAALLDPERRVAQAAAVSMFPGQPEATGDLARELVLDAVKSPDPILRLAAAERLGRPLTGFHPEEIARAESSVRDLAGDAEKPVRYAAALSAESRTGIGAREIAIFEAALQDDAAQASVRERAAWALMDQGPAAAHAVPVLLKEIGSSTGELRYACACALARINPSDHGVDEILEEAAQDRFTRHGVAAQEILARRGPR